ncbi:luciferin 4-monooxygenase-like [Musca vetustissima]|uniref:luciferin 4-monooxygenase-like n=1 Tax=Musca vetustissima TaxID=27455 RepID=UPI002AB66F9B|nr:luciferin 4-monooxygenase-like [Musca vetustissima]
MYCHLSLSRNNISFISFHSYFVLSLGFYVVAEVEQKIWSGPTVKPLYNYDKQSIGEILFGQMRLNPQNVLQILLPGLGELVSWAIRIALHLKNQQLGHEDIVGVTARNTLKLTSVVLGCLFNGTPMHAINPNYEEGFHSFGITKPQIIFCDGGDYEKIRRITASFKPTIYTMCDHIEGVPTILDLLEPTKMEENYRPETPILGGNQTIVILSSSGTTGLSKAVTVPASEIILDNVFSTIDKVFYTSSGIDWTSGLVAFMHNCYNGCTRVLNRKPFTGPEFIEMVKKYKITSAIMSPIQFVELLDCPDFTTENMNSLRLVASGGGYVSKQLIEKMQRVLQQCVLCNTIRELPDVVDCCVVGIYNERHGDVAGALVIKKNGSPLTSEKVVEHVRNRLREPQKQLHNGAFFVEKLPQNINGKILKREAREILKSFLEKSPALSSSASSSSVSSSSSSSVDR